MAQHILNQRPISRRPISRLCRHGFFLLPLALLVLLGVVLPWLGSPLSYNTSSSPSFPPSLSYWREYSLTQATKFVAKNESTVIVCTVSYPFLPFLNNWLISVSRQNHQENVLVIAEDYATLYKVNEKWPGHAVLIPPALGSQTAQHFGSKVYNFTFSLRYSLSIHLYLGHVRCLQTNIVISNFNLITWIISLCMKKQNFTWYLNAVNSNGYNR